MTSIAPPRRTVLVRRPNYANRGSIEFKRNLTHAVEAWLAVYGRPSSGPTGDAGGPTLPPTT